MLKDQKFLWLLATCAFVVTLELFAIFGYSLPEKIALPLFLIIVISVGREVLWKGVLALLHFNLKSINLLMLIAVAGAFYLGQYEEAAVVISLYTLAEKLEDIGIAKSKSALEGLIRELPQTVELVGSSELISIQDLAEGNVFKVRPGEAIPVDGIVVAGSSTIDESSITGEPIPKDKVKGDRVYSGSFNQHGYLEVKTSLPAADSTVQKIRDLTLQATKNKAPTQKFIESFARIYTPIMMILAFLITAVPVLVFGEAFNPWFLESLTLLVIACPCALVISTPISIYSAVGRASKEGVLVKGGKYLEAIACIKAMAFDKTRTLTLGKPHVTDVIPFDGYSEKEVLACAAGIELFSEHPLSKSIVDAAHQLGIEPHAAEEFKSFTGRGVKAKCTVCEKGHRCIGKLAFVLEEHHVPEEVQEAISSLQQEGKTVIVICGDHEVVGLIALEDEIRSDSEEAIRSLKKLRVEPILLTGDHQESADAVAKELGIDQVFAELLPEEKANTIHTLLAKHKRVGMTGDGVNDAPALAIANVGISMSGLGSDTALDTASIILLNNNLNLIPWMVRLGRRTLRIIRLNTVWAVSIKLLFVTLAVLGKGNLPMAIFADVGVTILVILNSLRLLY